jgi:hypothetical protein
MAHLVRLTTQPGFYNVLAKGAKNWRVANTKTPRHTFLTPVETILEENEEVTPEGEVMVDPESRPSMAQVLDTMEELTRCVAMGYSNGLFVSGPGGIGKTYRITETLRMMSLQEGSDYIKITGYSTPAGLYKTLCENSDKLIIFDDCDNITRDPVGLNLLKAVLDTLPVRQVCWSSVLENLPTSFVFTGRVIFISNMDVEKITNSSLNALMTRVLQVAIGGSREEIIELMILLLPSIAAMLTPDDQAILAEFLRDNSTRIKNLSLRWVVNLVSLYRFSPLKWQQLAISLR